MDTNLAQDVDLDTTSQEILLAASQHDIPGLHRLLYGDNTTDDAANARDADTGYTPLHSAVASCEADSDDDDDALANGNGQQHASSEAARRNFAEDGAAEAMELLLRCGARWNAADNEGETPGCIAHRLGLRRLYRMMVDAGVRAEMEMRKDRADGYERLGSDDGQEGEKGGEDSGDAGPETTGSPIDVVDSARAAAAARDLEPASPGPEATRDREAGFLAATAAVLLPTEGRSILVVGAGADFSAHEAFRRKRPSRHWIVSSPPAVLAEMRERGWPVSDDRDDSRTATRAGAGVVTAVHADDRRSALRRVLDSEIVFDAIYFDVRGDYGALIDFLEDAWYILHMHGRWSFYFDGFGAERQVEYDVSAQVLEIDFLEEKSFVLEWADVDVGVDDEGETGAEGGGAGDEGRKPRGTYRLPVVTPESSDSDTALSGRLDGIGLNEMKVRLGGAAWSSSGGAPVLTRQPWKKT